ncbi:MAG: prolipoprotein diacylglyceryl transferase [Desulfobulbus sp.]|nr:prolipoprotein diacylglyceryl transferase [Desulfobulbus sp.]
MNLWIFLVCSGLLFSLMIILGWRYLPGERFQILASVPVARDDRGLWRGINFTWYGLLLATAAVIAIMYVLLLCLAAGMARGPLLSLLAAIILLCVPSSRWVARLVEKKQYTFTIGGAFFCGLVATPLIILLINGVCLLLNYPTLPIQVVLAALSIGYILGEGLGRLACLSFGCCYGKRLDQCGTLLSYLLKKVAVVFTGPTKKAVYEGGLAGIKLVPIQGITSLLYTLTGLVGCFLFFQGSYRSAFLLCLLLSQIWRVVSEMFRADFRGFSSVSAYQKMGLASILYGILLCLVIPVPVLRLPDIGQGLNLLFNPLLLLGLNGLWFALFLHFGRSRVTSATLSFEVRHNCI